MADRVVLGCLVDQRLSLALHQRLKLLEQAVWHDSRTGQKPVILQQRLADIVDHLTVDIAELENELVHDRVEVLMHQVDVLVQKFPHVCDLIHKIEEVHQRADGIGATGPPCLVADRIHAEGRQPIDVVGFAELLEFFVFFLFLQTVHLLPVQGTQQKARKIAAVLGDVFGDVQIVSSCFVAGGKLQRRDEMLAGLLRITIHQVEKPQVTPKGAVASRHGDGLPGLL